MPTVAAKEAAAPRQLWHKRERMPIDVQLVQRHERALSAALAAEKRRRRRSAEHPRHE